MKKSDLKRLIIEEVQNTLKEQDRIGQTGRMVAQHCAAIQKACEAIASTMQEDVVDDAYGEGAQSRIVEDGIEIARGITDQLARLAVNRGDPEEHDAYLTLSALKQLGQTLGNLG